MRRMRVVLKRRQGSLVYFDSSLKKRKEDMRDHLVLWGIILYT